MQARWLEQPEPQALERALRVIREQATQERVIQEHAFREQAMHRA